MKLYLRILAYGKPHLMKGILGTAFLFVYNFFSVFSIALVIPFLQIIFGDGSASGMVDQAVNSTDPDFTQRVYLFVSQLIDENGRWMVLVYLSIALTCSILIKNVTRYASSWFIAPFEQGVINSMRLRLFDHLKIMSMPFFSGKKKGNIINILVSDVQIVQESVIGTVQNMISDPISMMIILVSLFLISWKLTLFSLIVLPVTGLFINFISKSLKKRARKGQERLGSLISILDEFIQGIRVVKAFSAEEYERDKYQKMNDDYRDAMISIRRKSDMASPLTEVLSIFVVVSILLFGGSLIIKGEGELPPSAFIGFIALFGSFIQPVKTFSSVISRIQRGIVSFQRIEEFLSYPEEVKEKENARAVSEIRKGLRFENVNFRYEKEEILKNVNIEVPVGKTIALVGPSGGGKSTIADLVPRFYDPVDGAITLDGEDIRNLKVKDLRKLIGVVTQEGILFNDSVLMNVAYGDSAPDRARAEAACKVANAWEFVSAMPQGLDTPIGERGTKLSGGQRQRLSIARAIYKNAPVLILDEATSALDSESERQVQQALDQLTEDKTTIVIAHRLSTIVKADRIYVVESGRIVESGTHQELLSQGGLYKSLYDIQFGS